MTRPSPSAEPPSELVGGTRLLDRYTILDRVGSGGMASIYRANDGRLDRIVCVKLLRLVLEGDSDADADADGGVYEASYAHFLREALALSKLQHPNTLRIYDFGYLDDGRPFQISEFLEGGNLETLVRARGPLSGGELLAVLERICGAVAEAHGHRIIHRDIKPSNILFSRVDDVLIPKLADFGIAQSKLRKREGDETTDDAGPTDLVSTVALFSPRWAAPEQLAGGEEGPTTDVYALALLTAFMGSARVLFAASDPRAHFGDRIRGDDFVRARLAALSIPAALHAPLVRAMHADPGARTASPTAFFDSVRDALGASAVMTLPRGGIRRKLDSVSVVVESASMGGGEPVAVAPPEQATEVGGRRVRLVEADERLDFTVTRADAETELRFRVTLLPARDGFAIHVKGLSTFVAKSGGRPTAAVTATTDGRVDFVDAGGGVVGALAWSFGAPSVAVGHGAGRAFAVGDGELVVPYTDASQAVALDLGDGREVVVMLRRA